MIDILTKPKDQLNINDLQALIDSRVQEDERIEFKRGLSAEKGQEDSWYNSGKLGKKAKTKILEEAVAFANAFGGDLILGIGEKESENGPGVANEISPIPRCAELANRLELIFRDCVEPHIPGIEIIPIPTEKQDGAGAIVIRVSRSRLAPHRVKPSLVCPIRRSDRCEEMTMREIQDLVLNLARGTEKLDTLLTERSKRFEEDLNVFGNWQQDAIGIRATAAPLGDEIWFDPGHKALGEGLAWHSVIARSGDDFCELKGENPRNTNDWRPILRGARMEVFYHAIFAGGSLYKKSYREVHCNGLVELGLVTPRSIDPLTGKQYREGQRGGRLPAEWLITMFANLMVWIDRLRNHARAPVAEYALELEVCIYGEPLPYLTVPETIGHFRRQRGDLSNLYDIIAGNPMNSTRFPRYSLGSSDEINCVLNLFELDLWNNVGLRDRGHDGLTIKGFGPS